MTHTVVSDLLPRAEDSTVEFKRSLTKDIGRELRAFNIQLKRTRLKFSQPDHAPGRTRSWIGQ